MKVNELQKLRDKLEEARDISVISDSCRDCYMIDTKNELINQALALLQLCITCGGTRKVKCKKCSGTGELSMGAHSDTCWFCDGNGNASCPDCKQVEPCKTCEGSGKVYEGDWPDNRGYISCPDCKAEPGITENVVANLLCYILDNHESEPLSEKMLQQIGTEFLKSKYNIPVCKQAEPGEILKETRALLKAGANEEQWAFATKLREVLVLIDRQQKELAASDSQLKDACALIEEIEADLAAKDNKTCVWKHTEGCAWDIPHEENYRFIPLDTVRTFTFCPYCGRKLDLAEQALAKGE